MGTEVTVFPCDLPAGRIISSPTGPLNNDYVDVRSFSEAAKKGILRWGMVLAWPFTSQVLPRKNFLKYAKSPCGGG
jgi:hypothetical protein